MEEQFSSVSIYSPWIFWLVFSGPDRQVLLCVQQWFLTYSSRFFSPLLFSSIKYYLFEAFFPFFHLFVAFKATEMCFILDWSSESGTGFNYFQNVQCKSQICDVLTRSLISLWISLKQWIVCKFSLSVWLKYSSEDLCPPRVLYNGSSTTAQDLSENNGALSAAMASSNLISNRHWTLARLSRNRGGLFSGHFHQVPHCFLSPICHLLFSPLSGFGWL